MEVIFDNYFKKQSNETIFNNLNFKLKEKKIYAIIGDDSSNKDKLFLNLKKSKSVHLNNVVISNIEKDNTIIKKDMKFLKYIYQNTKKKKEKEILDIISLTDISKDTLNSNLSELSNYNLKLLMIIPEIINGSNLIVLKEPFYKMNENEENDFIRIIRTIKNEYNLSFIILTKNTNIIYKFIDYFFVLNSGNIVLEGKREELEKIDSKFGIEKPEICKFIDIIRKKLNKNFRSFNDVRDLVKEIYRCTR